MNEHEMNTLDLNVLEVKKTEFVRDRKTGMVYIRYRLEDGAIVLVPMTDVANFVTASTLFR